MKKHSRYIFGVFGILMTLIVVKYAFEELPVRIEKIDKRIAIYGPGMDLLTSVIKAILVFSLVYALERLIIKEHKLIVERTHSQFGDTLVSMLRFCLGIGKYVLAFLV